MITIISFIIVLFGSLNWLCIGFFQYDIVAGLFGFQGSIFSRLVYIVVGIAAIYLTFSVIKNKGKITPKKLKKEEQPTIDKMQDKNFETIKIDEKMAKKAQNSQKNEQNFEINNIDRQKSSHINK